MKQYLDLVKDILANGELSENRTSTNTIKVFGRQMRFNLAEGFPLLTTKKVYTKGIIAELLWFLTGDTNSKTLEDQGVNIWKEWGVREEDVQAYCFKWLLEPENKDFATRYFQRMLEAIEPEDTVFDPEIHDRVNRNGTAAIANREKTKQAVNWLREVSGAPANGELGPIYQKNWLRWSLPSRKLSLEERIDLYFKTVPREEQSLDPSMIDSYRLDHIKSTLDANFIPGRADGETHNQIDEVINLLKTKPMSRRIIVNAWNPADLPDESKTPQENVLDGKMALAPCHVLFQFFVNKRPQVDLIDDIIDSDLIDEFEAATRGMVSSVPYENFIPALESGGGYRHPDYYETSRNFAKENGIPIYKLSCQLYQRSSDTILGNPFNVASYSLLTHMVAHVTNMTVGDFVWTGGDVHIYSDQVDGAKEQLAREPRPLPTLKINRKVESIYDFRPDDFSIEGYDPHPAIKFGPPAV